MPSSSFSRRRFGQFAAAGTAFAVFHGGAQAQGTPDASTPVADGLQPDGSWSFTDDTGVTVTLPALPMKIAMDLSAAAPLWDFGIRPVSVSGWTVSSDASWGNVDRDIPVVNASAGAPEPDIEKLLSVGSELFVTIAWGPGDIWSFTTPENYQTTNSQVPVVVISVADSADVNLQRFTDLAVALGADLESPELVTAKSEFETAVAAFSALATEKADLTSFFASIGVADDEWYAAYPPDWADLKWYQSLGMNIVEPDVEPGTFWESLSREEAERYPYDILFNSTRAGVSTADELKADALFGSLPAIAAGQIGAWNQDFILSYQGLRAALDTMSATVNVATKVT